MANSEKLREALEYLAKELHAYAAKNGLGPARLMHALCQADAVLEASQPIAANSEAEAAAHGWNTEQILVYIWQCMSGEQTEREYPYERFKNSEMGKRLRLELDVLTRYAAKAVLRELQLWNAPSESGMTRDHEYHIGFDSQCSLCRVQRIAALKEQVK